MDLCEYVIHRPAWDLIRCWADASARRRLVQAPSEPPLPRNGGRHR
jgi:hypothetical protein